MFFEKYKPIHEFPWVKLFHVCLYFYTKRTPNILIHSMVCMTCPPHLPLISLFPHPSCIMSSSHWSTKVCLAYKVLTQDHYIYNPTSLPSIFFLLFVWVSPSFTLVSVYMLPMQTEHLYPPSPQYKQCFITPV